MKPVHLDRFRFFEKLLHLQLKIKLKIIRA